MMPKPLQKIYLLFGLIALLIAIFATFFYSKKILPYRFELYKGHKNVIAPFSRHIFHDLNGDGFEERLILINDKHKQQYYIKVYQDYRNGLLDQFNFEHPLVVRLPSFFDINKDNWKELIVFTHNNKGLYLSIIDVKNQKFLQREVLVLPPSPKRIRKDWDIHSVFSEIVDLASNGHELLLFAVNSGYARLPRCLCLYDFKHNKIVKRFDHHFGPIRPHIVDLNRDGFKEIVLDNYATYNFPQDVSLSDASSWYIVLDHNLRFLKPPVRLGGSFSSVSVIPARSRFYLSVQGSNSPMSIMLIDSTYKIKKTRHINFLRTARTYQNGDETSIYVLAGSTTGMILDAQLNKRKKVIFPKEQANLNFAAIRNITGSPQPEVFCWNPGGIYLYDANWKLLGRYTFKDNASAQDVYLAFFPDVAFPILSLTRNNSYYQLKLTPEKYYGKLKWEFLGVFLLAFFILTLGFHILEKIWRYVSSFAYLLKQSDNAIILLDHKGRVVSVNKKVNRFLKLPHPLLVGNHYEESLDKRPEIIEAIQTCENTLKQTRKNFSFDDPLGTFIGEVTVTPFLSLFKFVYGYLIEIKDSTEQVLNERQRNWQRNIRRMVHDIKTPLAGVQLKLQMLFMKLSEEYPNLKENVFNELEDAYSELKRIRNISKDFLKFSDLEKPNIEEIVIEQFIDNVLHPFQLYNNEFMHIEIKLAPGVPKTVYWDKRQIEILLHIVIENSIDALQGQGIINIEVRPSPEIRNEELPWIEFRIQDNGPGIPEEIQSKIFEPHFSTKKEGSGLGLSFAKHIVEQHHGQISFFSSPNAGTVFIIVLPVRFE